LQLLVEQLHELSVGILPSLKQFYQTGSIHAAAGLCFDQPVATPQLSHF
jgi:hypothetical protein